MAGVVSASNSLVGSSTDDRIGSNSYPYYDEFSYVVYSPYWDNGLAADAGAVTWGNGDTGVTGVVSAVNSVVGSTAGDNIGISSQSLGEGVLLYSAAWDNGPAIDVGAFTYLSQSTGTTGAVSAANSLIGSSSDYNIVTSSSVTQIGYGSFVVINPNWNNGTVEGAGSVTFGTAAAGIHGVVGAANSLVGSSAGDSVGSNRVIILDGSVLVMSPNWDRGAVTDVGAYTWSSVFNGARGAVSESNSLVGDSTENNVFNSSLVGLSNGNFFFVNPAWDNGAIPDAGAVTFASATSGVSGVVGAANSLVGTSAYDQVGLGGITELSNGNFVVLSPLWDNGAIADAGAVTFGLGDVGISGPVTSTNSLVGTRANDQIGSGGIVLVDGNLPSTFRAASLVNALSAPLPAGNYLVLSPNWDNGNTCDTGAVTWGSGIIGAKGAVNAANSLVGSSTNDHVGSGGITLMSNGDYLVSSPEWNNGAIVDAGAITRGSSSTGVKGPITSSNSIVGLVSGANLQLVSTGDGTFTVSFVNDLGRTITQTFLSGSLAPLVHATYVFSGGAMTIVGTSEGDSITVQQAKGLIKIVDGLVVLDTGIFASHVSSITIRGLGGNDTLKLDRSLDDDVRGTLEGGADDDYLFSGLGNDVLDGGEGIDTVSYVQAEDGVNVSLALTSFQKTEGAGKDRLAGLENLIGSRFDDLLTGNSSDNVIEGGRGDDTLSGGDGIDWLDSGAGDDWIRFDWIDQLLAGPGKDTAVVTNSQGPVSVDFDQSQLEIVIATASTSDNYFYAASATWDVEIYGGSGNEYFFGGSGNDKIFGGAGDDSISGEAGNDDLNGGAGIDTVIYASATSPVTVNLSNRKATGGAGNDRIQSFENIVGSPFDDVLIGDQYNNIIYGGGGLDLINGKGGIDQFFPY